MHITVTVDHNNDELVLSLDDKAVKTISIKGTSVSRVQEFLERLLEEMDSAAYVSLEQIDEDKRKTINEW